MFDPVWPVCLQEAGDEEVEEGAGEVDQVWVDVNLNNEKMQLKVISQRLVGGAGQLASSFDAETGKVSVEVRAEKKEGRRVSRTVTVETGEQRLEMKMREGRMDMKWKGVGGLLSGVELTMVDGDVKVELREAVEGTGRRELKVVRIKGGKVVLEMTLDINHPWW